jgi:hypothetical protein
MDPATAVRLCCGFCLAKSQMGTGPQIQTTFLKSKNEFIHFHNIVFTSYSDFSHSSLSDLQSKAMISQNEKLTSIILPPHSACVIEIKGDRSILDENNTERNQSISIEFQGGETISIVKLNPKG